MRETEDMSRCIILIAEDDSDDRHIVEQAFLELSFRGELRFVEDGVELMNYLHRSDKYADLPFSPRPALILLDLNMPRKDGRQALAEIEANPELREIPVAIWTTSKDSADKRLCEEAGADFFLTKPESYFELSNCLQGLIRRYCFE